MGLLSGFQAALGQCVAWMWLRAEIFGFQAAYVDCANAINRAK
jgi:hypothetical protein